MSKKKVETLSPCCQAPVEDGRCELCGEKTSFFAMREEGSDLERVNLEEQIEMDDEEMTDEE